MKKKICLMLVVMLLLLSACGGQKTPETTAAQEETVLHTEDSVSVEALAAPEDLSLIHILVHPFFSL